MDLSGGRSLKLSLSFCDTWPRACTTYRDPLLNAAEAVSIGVVEAREIAADGQRAEGVPTTSARADGNGIISLLRRTLPLFKVVLRPATVTLILAIVLITAVILLRNGSSRVSAAELLAMSSRADVTLTEEPGEVIRRIYDLEEIHSGASVPAVNRRVEIWLSSANGLKARRVYDPENRLVAGEWLGADGLRSIYRSGSPIETESASKVGGGISLDKNNIWRIEPSAAHFSSLISDIEKARVEETRSAYVINYSSEGGADTTGGARLLRASLLKPIFFDEAAVGQNTDKQAVDFNQAVDELFDAASFNEKAIRLAFTISESSATPLIMTERFWLSLIKAERLADVCLKNSEPVYRNGVPLHG